ncbi:V-set domain-containing T-cell activation inhibitor 1-like [Mantella aurantiaca]
MESRITILCLMCTSFLLTLSSGEVRVTPKLYGTAELPCTFPFIRGLEDLTVVWEKVEDTGRRFLVHKSVAGRDDLSDQDSQYSGRTRFSGGVMKGNLQLTLTEATLRDEGTYYCRAANRKGHGDKKVELSIAGEFSSSRGELWKV